MSEQPLQQEKLDLFEGLKYPLKLDYDKLPSPDNISCSTEEIPVGLLDVTI